MHGSIYTAKRMLAGLVAVVLLAGAELSPAFADDGELLLFPEFTAIDRPTLPAGSGLDRNAGEFGLTLFYTRDFGHIRVLSEINSGLAHRNAELERFQVGKRLASGARLWVGRFHSPIGIWNSQHHHGAYVQTSVSRPAIVEYDDHGGPLQTHLSGLLWESEAESGGYMMKYTWVLGAGGYLDGGLKPLDLLRPNQGVHRPAAVVRVSRASIDDRHEVGAFASYALIAGSGVTVNEVKQGLIGGFIRQETTRTRTLAALFYVDNQLDLTGPDAQDSFSAAYVQTEYDWRPDLTLFGRLETSQGFAGDAYLLLLPEIAHDRVVAGVNFGISRRQAIKLELSSGWFASGRLDQITIQWAGTFP